MTSEECRNSSLVVHHFPKDFSHAHRIRPPRRPSPRGRRLRARNHAVSVPEPNRNPSLAGLRSLGELDESPAGRRAARAEQAAAGVSIGAGVRRRVAPVVGNAEPSLRPQADRHRALSRLARTADGDRAAEVPRRLPPGLRSDTGRRVRVQQDSPAAGSQGDARHARGDEDVLREPGGGAHAPRGRAGGGRHSPERQRGRLRIK